MQCYHDGDDDNNDDNDDDVVDDDDDDDHGDDGHTLPLPQRSRSPFSLIGKTRANTTIIIIIIIIVINIIIIIIITRPWPDFGRQGLVGSSGGYTYHGYASLRLASRLQRSARSKSVKKWEKRNFSYL